VRRPALPPLSGLLLLEFRERETFAWPCEAYGWIVEHAKTKADRRVLREEFTSRVSQFADERVDPAELAEIVGEACEARNGWKVILRRCAHAKTKRGAPTASIFEPDRSA
jgi:hypothetical protein